jgi:putative transposase
LGWIEPEHAKLPLMRQCELAGVPRATVYRRIDAAAQQPYEDEDDPKLRTWID